MEVGGETLSQIGPQLKDKLLRSTTFFSLGLKGLDDEQLPLLPTSFLCPSFLSSFH